MSYRTFKHLLGETSLERKCRFIFGGGIVLLVSISFYWYGQKTESLVIGQSTEAARMLVDAVLMKLHVEDEVMGGLAGELMGAKPGLVDNEFQGAAPIDESPRFDYHIVTPNPRKADFKPLDQFEALVLQRFLKGSESVASKTKAGDSGRNSLQFPDGTPRWESEILRGRKSYRYAQAVSFRSSCLNTCHTYKPGPDGLNGKRLPGEFAAAVIITLPMERVNKAIHQNRAILISAALVTAILAMFASWMIVRYVIVKPVKHLRDVSDAVAAGRLNVRSQIQTGDDFEELSHAFNRMIHNLVAMQQELRDVNNDLDRKVDELAQANMALYEMNRLKSDFLATMSHELRTPLNSIIGFSEVLAGNESLNDKQRRYAANIQSSGKMLLGMINDILDLAKIESGKMEVRAEDFSVRDVAEGLVNLLKPSAERKNIDLSCRIDDNVPLLRQDPGKIRQILFNLLSNAIKFTPEGGRVGLKVRIEGRNAILEVADTGIGIAPDDRDKIFEKFRQVNPTTQPDGVLTREHQGTGLGLSIVRELTKLLGGEITLESTPGLGSTFTVRLPLQLPGNRRFDVAVADERVDLSKARRVDPLAMAVEAGFAGPRVRRLDPTRPETTIPGRAAGS